MPSPTTLEIKGMYRDGDISKEEAENMIQSCLRNLHDQFMEAMKDNDMEKMEEIDSIREEYRNLYFRIEDGRI